MRFEYLLSTLFTRDFDKKNELVGFYIEEIMKSDEVQHLSVGFFILL
jgi:hypothetical protein